MTEEQKANIYGMLLSEHTRIHNRINEIKGQSIDLSKQDINQIKHLENIQMDIMRKINTLLSR